MLSEADGATASVWFANQTLPSISGAGRTALSLSQARARQWLVIGQIAASMVLLAGSALLYRSFCNLQNQQLGIHTKSVVTASISLGRSAYETQQHQMAFFEQLEQSM